MCISLGGLGAFVPGQLLGHLQVSPTGQHDHRDKVVPEVMDPDPGTGLLHA